MSTVYIEDYHDKLQHEHKHHSFLKLLNLPTINMNQLPFFNSQAISNNCNSPSSGSSPPPFLKSPDGITSQFASVTLGFVTILLYSREIPLMEYCGKYHIYMAGIVQNYTLFGSVKEYHSIA